MKIYMPIQKVEKADDGTLTVIGIASSESIDSDGETVKAEAMRDALPDFFKYGTGNLREMHQPSAAGTVGKAEVDSDGCTYIEAHVVDPIAVKKVEAGVYKGFSIGGKITGRDDLDKSIITGLKLAEISLVDRPANPEAIFTCYKAEGIDADNTLVPDSDSNNDLALAAKADDLAKGMYGVSQLSSILSDISWLAESTEWESQYEGDNSPLPSELRTWLSMGVDIFRAMAAEETAEMLASLNAMVPQPVVVETLEQGAKVDDLQKAGAKFGADAKDKIGKAHKAIKEASDHLDSLGYDKADDEGKDSGKSSTNDDLAKVAGELDLAKAENDSLKKRVKELESLPAPGKAILKVIAKVNDTGEETAAKVEPVKDAKGEVNEIATMIKMAHAHR